MADNREFMQLVGIEFYRLELLRCFSAAKRLTWTTPCTGFERSDS